MYLSFLALSEILLLTNLSFRYQRYWICLKLLSYLETRPKNDDINRMVGGVGMRKTWRSYISFTSLLLMMEGFFLAEIRFSIKINMF